MKRRLYFLVAFGAVAAVALAFHAVAQPPATTPPASRIPQNVPSGLTFVPRTTADGRTVYAVGGHHAPDAETLKLMTQEQTAAQESRDLAAQYAQAESEAARADLKTKLRDKLAAIFDLQQQRRAREIGQIEERLGKLKETMKKRDGNKDPIIDRRVEQLTGGVDELGWEETGGVPDAGRYGPATYPGTPMAPGIGPNYGLPGAAPMTRPAPVPVPPLQAP